jgi:hypothetical protein
MGPRLGIWLLALAFALLPMPVRGEAGPPPEAPNRQDELWSHVKNVRAGPVTFDFGGQVRFRYENDDGFTIKGYEPGGHDELLLERVRLDLSARFRQGPRLVLQQNLRFFLGASDRRPAFGRFTYFEKFDYWAVFWGCAIMIGTGLALWFHGLVRTVVPRIPVSAFDVFKEAHAHEAVLAFLAVVIWHAYNVHLGAGRFPWNWAWIHGRVRREELEAEHPLDPSLKKPEAGAMA